MNDIPSEIRDSTQGLAEKMPVDPAENRSAERPSRNPRSLYPYLVVASFLVGFITSYFIWGGSSPEPVSAAQVQAPTSTPIPSGPNEDQPDFQALIAQVNPAQGFTLPIQYGDLGPRLIEAGVIDYDAFAAIYTQSGTPLSSDQLDILQLGSDAAVVITSENAHFLLNFFWAVGLANKNPILTEGPMIQNSAGQVERFASTGGWSLATRPVTEIYASLDLISLTEEQQQRVENVAAAVYRPCCDNSTLFPDCNHGMAMLGILELMASQGASEDEMFQAAMQINAFWFPQQTLETAVYIEASQQTDFVNTDPRLAVGKEFSSGSGSAQVHAALQRAGLLQQAPGGGNGCAN